MQEIRQHNLKILRDEFKTQRAFADAIDATPGYVSQLLIGSCKFGEKTARKIEGFLGRPDGWLDDPQDIEPVSPFYKIFESLSREQKKQVEDYVRFIASQSQESTQPTPEIKPLTNQAPNAGGGG